MYNICGISGYNETKSGRTYKNDLSDILGILAEHEKRHDPLLLSQIQKAVIDETDNL